MMPPTVTRQSRFRAMEDHARDAAHLLKAMANEQRLLILCHLAESELSVGQLHQRLDLSQSALSQHLGVLRRYGLVTTRRESRTIYYYLTPGAAVTVMQSLYDVYCAPSQQRRRSRQ